MIQLILNTDEIKYAGQGILKENQYIQKTISRRYACYVNLFFDCILLVIVSVFGLLYFNAGNMYPQSRWPQKLHRSATPYQNRSGLSFCRRSYIFVYFPDSTFQQTFKLVFCTAFRKMCIFILIRNYVLPFQVYKLKRILRI